MIGQPLTPLFHHNFPYLASWQVVSPHVSTQMADWTPTAEILHGELGALFTIEMTRGDRFTM